MPTLKISKGESGLKIFKPAFFIMQSDIIEGLKGIIQPIIQRDGLELIDFVYRREGGRNVLRLLVDKSAGRVSLDDCARLNKKISSILDGQDLLEQSFALEVNSPGIDRPIVTKHDFRRNLGSKIRIIIKNQKGTVDIITGNLKSVGENDIILDIEGAERDILFEDIIKARREI